MTKAEKAALSIETRTKMIAALITGLRLAEKHAMPHDKAMAVEAALNDAGFVLVRKAGR